MADIQLRQQFPAEPDLSVGSDLSDYDIWLREQFPAAPDLSCYPTQWGIAQALTGPQAITGTLAFTLDGITFAATGTVTGSGASVTGTMAFTLDGIAAEFTGVVTTPGGVTLRTRMTTGVGL